MKNLLGPCLFALLAMMGSTAFSEEFTKGVVTKVDTQGKKVTVRHEELKNLEMPAMTMVFRTADDAMLDRMAEGQEIEFIADRLNGKITIIELK